MLMVAGAALVFAIFVAFLRWAQYPHINLTIFNETSSAICDLRITFLHGERTADRIQPGGFAVTEIESGGDSTVLLSHLDADGIRKNELIYGSGDLGGHTRGFLEVHLTNEGTQLVNGVYSNVLLDILGWTRHVSPSGRMNVK